MKLTEPLHFAPLLKSVIWGGNEIARYKGISTTLDHIGESWEVSALPGHESVVDRGPLKGKSLPELAEAHGPELLGTRVTAEHGTSFPLMVKIIDAARDLSVQVHPGDEMARREHGCSGKSEMWHIIKTRRGAHILLGLTAKITPDEYVKLVEQKRILNVIANHDCSPGDTFFVPAGRVHSICAGNLLVEVQQSSDITYRIYDYGRIDKDGKPRQLHTDLARRAIDFNVNPRGYREPPLPRRNRTHVKLMDTPMFKVVRHESRGHLDLPHSAESFTVVMAIEGSVTITYPGGSVDLPCGDTILVPAAVESIAAEGHATLLTITA